MDDLAKYLIEEKRFHELFEVRKLQLRHRLQLPIDRWQPIDDLPDNQGRELETGLLDICREVGTMLFESGDVASGWQYLEPVGDRKEAVRLLQQADVTDENVEALIQVAVGQGLDPEFGFQLVLERFGTCSSITTFESRLAGQSVDVRRGPARLLVQHLYDELVQRVRESIREQEGDSALDGGDASSLEELMTGRDWLFEGLGHHIDTTHLASTARISRLLDDEPSIRKAIELTRYGQRLHPDFHYPGNSPFQDTYRDTMSFLQALSGVDADTEVERLRRATLEESESKNLDSATWYVYLLDRLGRGAETTSAYFEWIHAQQSDSMISEDICPNLLTIVSKYREFELARTALLNLGDLLGYATVVAVENQTR